MRDGPDLVVIGSVILRNSTQLRFVEHHQVVERFAPDRAYEELDMAVLPRRLRYAERTDWQTWGSHSPLLRSSYEME